MGNLCCISSSGADEEPDWSPSLPNAPILNEKLPENSCASPEMVTYLPGSGPAYWPILTNLVDYNRLPREGIFFMDEELEDEHIFRVNRPEDISPKIYSSDEENSASSKLSSWYADDFELESPEDIESPSYDIVRAGTFTYSFSIVPGGTFPADPTDIVRVGTYTKPVSIVPGGTFPTDPTDILRAGTYTNPVSIVHGRTSDNFIPIKSQEVSARDIDPQETTANDNPISRCQQSSPIPIPRQTRTAFDNPSYKELYFCPPSERWRLYLQLQ
ncbi:hypothetical protein DMENIID0001_082190 [Sergentomyia squamirostris]